MSVRAGLLAILTLGPAYGLQLHTELAARASHRGPINAGQIYSTLDRLGAQGLIRSSGRTAEGLPLYRLSTTGRAAAEAWFATPDLTGLPEWTDMLDQVLITASLDRARALELVEAFDAWWVRSGPEPGALFPGPPLAEAAVAHRAAAALAWLATARSEIRMRDLTRPYSDFRPRRGRRPLPASG